MNAAASAPPFFVQVRSSLSASVAVSVVTAVMFSATDSGDSVVISGALLVEARRSPTITVSPSDNPSVPETNCWAVLSHW